MIRKAFSKQLQNSNKEFHLRGHEVKRIETFSDSVFAFAVTLLIVSLEVPKTFEELMTSIRGFFAFGNSFLYLMFIWYEQNVFFRRYGLDSLFIIILNCLLIFVVLFYVYPLKFLFNYLYSNQIYGSENPFHITVFQLRDLMLVYAAGFIFIFLIFFFMYAYALHKKKQLELTLVEQFDTKSRMFSALFLTLIGLFAVILALVLPVSQTYLAGVSYAFIIPELIIFYSFRKHKRKKIKENIHK